MAKPKGEEREGKLDDLEIISIGSLYDGPWEKKYWSSSRGKDRSPYPTGYKAIRTYNGNTYNMEIHEGAKGPLFLITSADGHSCSGQTPDIAWEKFQKTSCPRLKLWHGKRSSCKIDGVEFFGFKNPFVQRLLRELVANINGTAEQNLLSSSFCNEASGMEDDKHCADACTYPYVLPYVAIPQIRKKRSGRCGIINTKLVGRVGSKRQRPQDLSFNTDVSNSEQKNQRNHEQGTSMSPFASKEETDLCRLPGARPVKMHLKSEVSEEIHHFSSSSGFPLKLVDLSDHLRERTVPVQEDNELASFKNYKSTAVANKLSEEVTPLDRSQDTEDLGSMSSMAIEGKAGDAPVTESCPDINEVNLCAPDTLDFVHDETTNSASSTQDKSSTHNVKEELTDADMVITEGLVAESQPEEEIAKSYSNASFEKSDVDLAGQDIAKSMMTFLLPQAIPLLKKASRKKKTTVSPSEILSCRVQSQEENSEANHFVDIPSPAMMLTEKAYVEREEKMQIQNIDSDSVAPRFEHNKSVVLDSFDDDQCGDHVTNNMILSSRTKEADLGNSEKAYVERVEKMQIQNIDSDSVAPSFEHNKSVVLDSFDDDQCGDHVTNHMILSSHTKEADLGNFDKDTCPFHIQEQLVSIDMWESSVSDVEASGSKDIFSYDDLPMVLKKKLQDGDAYKAESVLGCTLPSKSEEVQDVCANLDENCVNAENHYMEKDLIYGPDSVEGDANPRSLGNFVQSSRIDATGKTGPAEIGPFIEVPSKVYTRNKVSNKAHRTKKCGGSLSEVNIICRNFGDDCVTETSPARRTLFASEVHQVSSSNDKPHKRDPFVGAEIRLERKNHSLHTEKTNINFKAALNNTATVISQKQTLVHASEGKDMLTSFDQSVSHVEKFQAHCDKELVEYESLTVPVISQNVRTFSCDNNTSNAKEVLASSDLNLHRDLELNSELEDIVELVGCYFHPLPISSVLLNTAGNEIYICVSCGLLVDKDRTLFVYKVAINEPREGCPSFLGQTSVKLPFLKDNFGREFAVERSGLQFTPDGQYLVLLDSIKTPYCREGRIDCMCSTCTSDYFQENAVKIVEVKCGHVSVVTKLKTDDCLKCILVCYPNFLIAVGESGRLHLWVMNSTWSAQMEEFVIPVNQCISPCIVELKKIPKCAHLVVGHNGFGEFSLWDILKRAMVSRFSAQSTSIYQFFPISLFSWHPISSHSALKGHIDRIMAATKSWFSDHSNDHPLLPIEGDNVAIWLIVSTVSDSDAQDNYISNHCQTNPARWWRLALLVKNVVIFGSALDPSAAVIGASSGHGIIGTQDGLVYMWELSTGTKLGTLHDFNGRSISCIATDDSRSGIVGIAGDDGQLLVYLHSQKVVANQ